MSVLPFLLPREASEPVSFAAGGNPVILCSDLLRDSTVLTAALPPLPSGKRVALLCRDRYFLAVGLVAAWRSALPVVLPPAFTEQAFRQALASDHVAAVFHDLDRPDGLRVQDLLTGARGAAGDAARVTPAQVLLTLYTSGSSGAQQALDKTAAQLLGEAQLLLDQFGLEPGFRVVSTVPSQHIFGLLFGVLLPLLGGGSFLRETPLFPESIQGRISDATADVLVTVPAHLPGLLLLPAGALGGLKRVFCSTAPLRAEDARAFFDRHGLELTEIFGSTETGGIGWRQRPSESKWTPFPGMKVSSDCDGRLLLDSPFLPLEWTRPWASQDRVEMSKGGCFRHLGRLDDVVKVGGKRVSLRHMEAVLLGIEGVEDAVVVHRPRQGGRNAELLAAVVAPGHEAEDLREALKVTFDSTLIPRIVRLMDQLPRSASGKLLAMEKDALFAAQAAAASFLPHRGPESLADGKVAFEFAVPERHIYFEGHFPGFPILPGVTQIHELVLPQVRALRPGWGEPRRLVRLKFERPIAPGDELRLLLDFDDERQRVVFLVQRDRNTCSSGRLLFQS